MDWEAAGCSDARAPGEGEVTVGGRKEVWRLRMVFFRGDRVAEIEGNQHESTHSNLGHFHWFWPHLGIASFLGLPEWLPVSSLLDPAPSRGTSSRCALPTRSLR